VSVGVDVVDVDRIRETLARRPGLALRLFTERERDYCLAHSDPEPHYAGTLAAKEAVIKACALGPLVAWARRIEISRAPSGAPSARVGDLEVPLSISHEGSVAVAVALAVPTADGSAVSTQ
jgi:holo-[acyl-carrier protein] synthase